MIPANIKLVFIIRFPYICYTYHSNETFFILTGFFNFCFH
jgi:hypothetical protein